jgi:hypothetical protein
MFTFLAATQDIIVDGWALTMLSKYGISPVRFSAISHFKLISFSGKMYLGVRLATAWDSQLAGLLETSFF